LLNNWQLNLEQLKITLTDSLGHIGKPLAQELIEKAKEKLPTSDLYVSESWGLCILSRSANCLSQKLT